MDIYAILVTVHAIAGSIVLLTAVIAILTKIAGISHKWHIYSGIPFTYAMGAIFLTGMPMAAIRKDIFTGMIGIFTIYFVIMGWRFARNRRGTPTRFDWAMVSIMLIAGAAMVATGLYSMLSLKEPTALVIVIFGAIGLVNAWEDLGVLRAGGATGKQRISLHLNRMLPATIAAVTAFLVLNMRGVEPAFVVWLAPTFILTPIIFWWDRRLKANKRPTGMPE